MGQSKVTRRWRWFVNGLLTLGLVWLVGVFVLAALIHYTGLIDNARPADVIIVLGSGLERDERPGPALRRRSSHAADLYHAGYADAIICTGGIGDHVTRSEADGCREVLESRGVPRSAILLEENSRSTEENAIYSRPLIAANGWDDILLVSDSYHVFRASYIFGLYAMEVTLSPVNPALVTTREFYLNSVAREIVALHWQIIKDALNLPFTSVALI